MAKKQVLGEALLSRYYTLKKNTMAANKLTGELLTVIGVNTSVFAISFTNIEMVLKIFLLLLTIGFTIDRWLRYRRTDKNKNKNI